MSISALKTWLQVTTMSTFNRIFVKRLSVITCDMSNQVGHRKFSKLLSNSGVNAIVRQAEYSYYSHCLKYYADHFQLHRNMTNLGVMQSMYKLLEENYRNEYVYKNALINKKLLGTYSLNTATIINEFKIGQAKADMVLLNGTSVVFEVKTELDSPERVLHQVANYEKVFANVNIVTHHSLESKYLSMLPKHIGVISLSKRFNLSTKRNSTESLEKFDHETVMRSLRTGEYSNIIKSYHGFLPVVPNTIYFKECLTLFKQIPVPDLHRMMVQVLKKRTIKAKDYFLSDELPAELKHICFCLNFTKGEYEMLNQFLNQKACTYLTYAENSLS